MKIKRGSLEYMFDNIQIFSIGGKIFFQQQAQGGIVFIPFAVMKFIIDDPEVGHHQGYHAIHRSFQEGADKAHSDGRREDQQIAIEEFRIDNVHIIFK